MTNQISSMTGYANANSSIHGFDFSVEMKSVNAKGLDIRLRLGTNLEILENKIRKKISSKISRGSIYISINLQNEAGKNELVVNEKALNTVLSVIEKMSKKPNMAKARPDGILALKGILELKEILIDEKILDKLQTEVFALFEQVLDDLIISRQIEGAQLKEILLMRLDNIYELTKKADNHPSTKPDVILQKLTAQISALSEANENLTIERLNQEAMILATKADIAEELDRFYAHEKAARDLILNGGTLGRKLDFLSQEFNREANTLCSKSNSVELSAIGLDLKAEIEKFREQLQNIE